LGETGGFAHLFVARCGTFVPGTGKPSNISTSIRHTTSVQEAMMLKFQCDAVTSIELLLYPNNSAMQGDTWSDYCSFCVSRKPDNNEKDCAGFHQSQCLAALHVLVKRFRVHGGDRLDRNQAVQHACP
jgi:hypothetical protein